jgi:large subunit ribosomal protein L3
MSHVTFVDNAQNSLTKGEVISVPVTILDVPKIKVYAIRVYSLDKMRQINCVAELQTDKLDKELAKKICVPKKKKNHEEEIKKVDELIGSAKDVRVVVYTLPEGRASGKKKPDIFEIAVGGKDLQEKYNYAKTLLGKELAAKDVLKPGEQVDTIAVTKGKGFQGVIKRSGSKLQPRNKSDTSERMVASIGPDRPRKVMWQVPMPGQMGFHNRYDYNKRILKIGENSAEVNPTHGFLGYGVIPKEYIMILGSVPGARNRLVRMRLAVKPRNNIPAQAPEILSVSRVKK